MTDLSDELQALLDQGGDSLNSEERKALKESIEHLRKTPGVKFKNPDKFDAKDMIPTGTDEPID